MIGIENPTEIRGMLGFWEKSCLDFRSNDSMKGIIFSTKTNSLHEKMVGSFERLSGFPFWDGATSGRCSQRASSGFVLSSFR